MLSNKILYYDNSRQMIRIGQYIVSIQSSLNHHTCITYTYSLH